MYGIVTTEDFGILDELYTKWVFTDLINRNHQPIFKFGFSPLTSEVGKVASAEISLLATDGGSDLSATPAVLTNMDIPMGETALVSQDMVLPIPLELIAEPYNTLFIKIRRIASTSNELIGDVGLHHLLVDYKKFLN